MAQIESINPTTGKSQFDPIEESTDQEVNVACQKARAISLSWSGTSLSGRALVLEAIATKLEANSKDLASLANSETALGEDRLTGEISRTTFQLRAFATALKDGALWSSEINEPIAGAPPTGRPHIARHLIGIGPVAVFGAGNFPFAFGELGGDTASALAAGCPVVVKEHPGHPKLAQRVIELSREAISESGQNPDLIQGVRGLKAGSTLVAHPDIRAVGFTGSQFAGRLLFDVAQQRKQPIPFYGELGSMNPVFISAAALAARTEQIATEAAGAISMGLGQLCTKPALIFVPNDDEFIELLVQKLTEVKSGPLLSPSSRERFATSVAAVGKVAGVEQLLSISRSEQGLEVSPGLLRTTFDNFQKNASQLLQECFGPVALVVTVSSQQDFLAAISELEGCLVATVHGESEVDQELVRSLMAPLSEIAGRIVINGWPTGLAVAPAQNHGGPYPAGTSPIHTSVGLHAAQRFMRPVVIQNAEETVWPKLGTALISR